MKMLNREEFLKLPSGVLYYHAKKSKGEGYRYSGLAVKGDTVRHQFPGSADDWWSQEIGRFDDVVEANDTGNLYDTITKAETEGSKFSFAADFASHSRDGCFDLDDRFAVLEVADVMELTGVVCACAQVYTTQALEGLEATP